MEDMIDVWRYVCVRTKQVSSLEKRLYARCARRVSVRWYLVRPSKKHGRLRRLRRRCTAVAARHMRVPDRGASRMSETHDRHRPSTPPAVCCMPCAVCNGQMVLQMQCAECPSRSSQGRDRVHLRSGVDLFDVRSDWLSAHDGFMDVFHVRMHHCRGNVDMCGSVRSVQDGVRGLVQLLTEARWSGLARRRGRSSNEGVTQNANNCGKRTQ